MPIRNHGNAETILTFSELLKSHLFAMAFPPKLLPVDEPVLASIMTHARAKDFCASEFGPLRI